MKQDKTDVRPIFQGLTSVISLINCQRQDIERLFPALGVRFIAINDNYDSLDGKNNSDDIIIPFKNLINDAYCRDISIKIRSHLEVKRRNGEFIGSFAEV